MGGALDAANFRPCCCSQEHFTGRELDILSLIASGHTNNSIARTLQISAHTVARHNTSTFRCFGPVGVLTSLCSVCSSASG
jgi:DNA-binding NarL/FixJ family response regulator